MTLRGGDRRRPARAARAAARNSRPGMAAKQGVERMDGLSLDAIGRAHGTDKSSAHHDYLRIYERFFQPLRDRPVTILEIGVFGGASLRTWEAYVPQARIVGGDIDPLARRHQRGRIEVEIMDQSNLDDLVRVASRHGPFDIVIEDGSHLWDDQIVTLKALFPYVRAGGIYAVEDLQTNYGAYTENYRSGAPRSCMDFLKSWLDLHVSEDPAAAKASDDPFLRTYASAAEAFHFHPRLCLIAKRGVPRPPGMVLSGPLRPLGRGEAPAQLGLLAHCSYAGDVYGPAGCVDLGFDRFALQGLALEAERDGLEYRVRGPDGLWSEWVAAPAFAGVRGRGLELTGVAVRLREDIAGPRGLRVIARFAGSAELVEARQGEDCVAPDGALAPLTALQVDWLSDFRP